MARHCYGYNTGIHHAYHSLLHDNDMFRYLACFVCTTSSRFFMSVFGIMILKEIYKQVTISFYLILLSMIIQKRILLQFIINASS